MSSPVLSSNGLFNPEKESPRLAYRADDLPMTVESTLVKTAGLFFVVLATAAVGWFFPIVAFPAMIIGLVLGLIQAFKKEPSVALIISYGVFEGLFLGGISSLLESIYPGVVVQATLATFVTVAVVLALFSSGKVRASKKGNKIFLVAASAYFVFSLINVGLQLFGVTTAPFGLYGETVMDVPLGLIIGPLAILLASYSLVMDFDFVQNGVARKIPQRYEWTASFGILVTVIWIYLEFIRLISLLRR